MPAADRPPHVLSQCDEGPDPRTMPKPRRGGAIIVSLASLGLLVLGLNWSREPSTPLLAAGSESSMAQADLDPGPTTPTSKTPAGTIDGAPTPSASNNNPSPAAGSGPVSFLRTPAPKARGPFTHPDHLLVAFVNAWRTSDFERMATMATDEVVAEAMAWPLADGTFDLELDPAAPIVGRCTGGTDDSFVCPLSFRPADGSAVTIETTSVRTDQEVAVTDIRFIGDLE